MIAGRCRLYGSRHRRLPLVREQSTISSWPTCCQTTTHSYSTPSHSVFNSTRYTRVYMNHVILFSSSFMLFVPRDRYVICLRALALLPPSSFDTRLDICTLSRRVCVAPLAVVRRTFLSYTFIYLCTENITRRRSSVYVCVGLTFFRQSIL